MPKLDHSKTEQCLVEGLLALIAQRPLYEIQARELCAHSGVSRSTFYKHYGSLEGFVAAIESAFIAQMETALSGTNVFLLAISMDARETFARCTEFMHAHTAFVCPMIGPNGSPTLRHRIARLWADQVKEALTLLAPLVRPDLDVEFFSTCVSASMLALLERDLSDQGAYSPGYVAHQMATILYDCLLKGALVTAEPRRQTLIG